MNNNTKFNRSSAYKIISVAAITIIAIAFAFPLYWIITGSFKTSTAINATTPQWWPQEWGYTIKTFLSIPQKPPPKS